MFSDELQRWRLHLREEQQRSLEHVIQKKNKDEGTSFQNLNHMYATLLMHNSSDQYKRQETRTRFDNLNLMTEIEQYSKINVTDLFVAKTPDMMTPVRTLVTGSAGIGKSLLCLHILDHWLKGELLPDDIDHVFLIHLRDLSSSCSLEDLFFRYQPCTRPSPEAISEFFKQLFAEPNRTLLIFDGWDEIRMERMKTQEKYDYDKQVDVPTLVASIISRSNLPSVRVLVTSRPGDVTNSYIYDKEAVIYGFTRETMSDYIVEFSGDNHALQKSLEDYIDHNVNIQSLCYVPVHLNLVCRIMKERIQNNSTRQLPETFTELYIAAVRNMLANHYTKDKDSYDNKPVFVEHKDDFLSHAKLAKHGMAQVPVNIMFSVKEVQNFHLEDVIMKCGLMTNTREQGVVDFIPAATNVYYYNHLTLQEFMAAVGILNNNSQLPIMIRTASGRQLDLMLMFLAGLAGNNRTHGFLKDLGLKPRTVNLDKLITLIVKREKRNEAKIKDDYDRSMVHKSSTLWLMMIIYESRQVQLWQKMSDYILEDSSELDLSHYHISPTELHALAYVLPETHITSLK